MKLFTSYTTSNSFVNTIADKGTLWRDNAGKRVYIIATVCWMAVILVVFLWYRYLDRTNNNIDKGKNEVQVIPSTGLLPNSGTNINIEKIKKAVPNLNPAPGLPALTAEEQKIKIQVNAMNACGKNFEEIGIKTTQEVFDFVQANGKALIRLDLTGLDIIGFDHMFDKIVEQLIKCCPNLHELIIYSDEINGSCLLAMVEELKGLTNLKIASELITDERLLAVAKKLPGLTSLNINECKQITDKGLLAVAEKLQGLTSLDISWCKITDQGLLAVAEKLPGLTNPNISQCHEITDEGLIAVAEKLKGLTSLDIHLCGQITDKGFHAVAEKLQDLTNLDLHLCTQITDKVLIAMVKQLHGLRKLDLCFFEQLTDEGLFAIAENLQGLTSLDISNCDQTYR